ncbi:DUF3987 domain-containing protein [Albimonas sp. CAU 1670]|uniref:DUF3987 domain-containing protein n=1 Tax=Albimonas sp. CAU 1670 TaxID=3032599 RepID=UPI0023DACBC8|nr:DUF3987 domain-containing protein [Albimonas sp. CAU 1670]MDF2234960.1 DUF3987 domain-containing protein [Albimonas sp. CAU 1670]
MTLHDPFKTTPAEAALALAAAGLPVFPCDGRPKPDADQRYPGEPRKSPLTSNGFKDATADAGTVAAWWRRYPEALPAVPTGAASGFFIADADIDDETGEATGEATLAALGIDAAHHRHSAPTLSGGRHFVFRWREGLPGNSTKTRNGLAGVDIRSEGGYVVAWRPEALIAAKAADDLEDPPAALLAALRTKGAQEPTGERTAGFDAPADASAWAEAALDAELRALRGTAPGGRNDALNRAAFSLGQIVGGGRLDRDRVEAELVAAALSIGLGKDETARTIRSGLDGGGAEPRGPKGSPGGGFPQDREGEGWPELIPLEGGVLPCLSPEMLGGWLGDFASALSKATETPFELAACMTLGAASAAVARRMKVQVKPGYLEPCNLWLLPALAPGNRKSSVEKAAAAPLRAWERDQSEAMQFEIAAKTSEADVARARAKELKAKAAKEKTDASARDMARLAAQIEADAPAVPLPPQIWTSDATPENLGVLLAAQGERIAWISAEGGFFEIVGGRYSNGVPNLDLMLKAHSGDPERVDRIGRPSVHLSEPLLTVAMSPQPELLRGLAARPGFRGRGLLARFLYFLPRSPLGYRTLEGAPVPPAVEAAYARGLRALLDMPAAQDERGRPCLRILFLSPAAHAAFHAFALHIETEMRPGGRFESLTDWAGKAPGAAARLAGVLHAADHAGGEPWAVEIPPEAMERALAIIATAAEHTLAAHRLMQADPVLAAAEALWRWIKRNRRLRFPARDAWQGLKGRADFAKMADVTAALEVLSERGYLLIVNPPRIGSGRARSPDVIVRPELAEGWE